MKNEFKNKNKNKKTGDERNNEVVRMKETNNQDSIGKRGFSYFFFFFFISYIQQRNLEYYLTNKIKSSFFMN